MKKTVVLNLWAGPGRGKSTLAAELFAYIKKNPKALSGILGLKSNPSVELVAEAAKDWAWTSRPIGTPGAQLSVLAEQYRRQSLLYGSVDLLIVDSPIGLQGFYSADFADITKLLQEHDETFNNVKNVHLYLPKVTEFDPRGRYQKDAVEADRIHKIMATWLWREAKLSYLVPKELSVTCVVKLLKIIYGTSATSKKSV